MTYALKPDAFPPSKAGSSEEWAPSGRRQHGFIAQEVEHVAPEVVAEDGNGYKAVAYSRLVPTLAAALSAALDRLDKLEEIRAVPVPATAERSSFSSASTIPATDEASTTNPSPGSPDVGREFKDYGALHSTLRKQGHRTATVGVDGPQTTGGSDSEQATFDLVQLWVENTALRGRVGDIEKRMVELERKLEGAALVGAATGKGGVTA